MHIMQELQALADTVGSVSRGLPTHIIDSLPISRYHRQAPLPAAANSSNSILIDLCTPDGRTGRAGVPIISIDDTPEQQVRGPSQEVTLLSHTASENGHLKWHPHA